MSVSNMNGITRTKLYDIIAMRDNEYCRCCGKLPHEGQLVIDHKDNNNSNNDLNNLQLLCRRCNYLKNPRNGPLDKCVRENDTAPALTELETRRIKSPQFNKYLSQRVNETGIVEEKDLVNSAAKILDISSVTAKRWLDVETSSEGIYERHKMGNHYVIRYKKELPLS